MSPFPASAVVESSYVRPHEMGRRKLYEFRIEFAEPHLGKTKLDVCPKLYAIMGACASGCE